VRPLLRELQGAQAAIEAELIDELEAACDLERRTFERHAQQHPYDESRIGPGNAAGHTSDARNSRALIHILYTHSIRLARRHIHLRNGKRSQSMAIAWDRPGMKGAASS